MAISVQYAHSAGMKYNYIFVYALSLVLLLQVAALCAAGVSSSITANVFVPANAVEITSISTSSSFSTSSPIPLNATLYNYGTSASTNIILNVSINGPSAFNSLYPVSSLSPSQGENALVEITGAIPTAGTYTLNTFASYYYGNVFETSTVLSLQFTVTSGGGGGGGGTSKSGGGGGGGGAAVAPIPGVSITTIPMLTSAVVGQGLVTQISLQSTSNVTEILNFSVGGGFSNLLNLSVTSITLQPKQSVGFEATFLAGANTLPGTYVIPLIVTVRIAGAAALKQTEYLSFTVYSNTNNSLQIVGQTYLTNSLRTLSGVVSIRNNLNVPIYNGTLFTILPTPAINNISDIYAYGLPNNITKTAAGYTVVWQINQLFPGQQLYAYYQINNVTRPNLLSFAQNIFTIPTTVSPSSIVRIVNISAQTFNANSTNPISASVFYTGTITQPVTFYMTSPSYSRVSNPIQILNASPNQLLRTTFNVSVGNYTGTLLFYLSISTGGYNTTTPIPVLVVPASSLLNATSNVSTGGIFPIASAAAQYPFRIFAFLVVAIGTILIVYYGLRFRKRPPKYDPEKAKNLARLRDRISGAPSE